MPQVLVGGGFVAQYPQSQDVFSVVICRCESVVETSACVP